MSRTTSLALAAAAFIAALIGGALVADALRSDTPAPALPEAVGEVVPVLAGEVIDPGSDEVLVVPEAGLAETVVIGEYAAVETSGGGGGPAAPASPEGAAPSGAGDDGRGYPWEVADLVGLSPVELLFGSGDSERFRFLDFCADAGDDPSCPSGVGGTVLVPFGGEEGAIGEFDVRNSLYTARADWWDCSPPSGLRATDYFLLISATHPARMEIEYYPVDDPEAIETVVLDYTAETHRVFTDFLATVAETGGPPVSGVHYCFVLGAERRQRTYVIDARATSFTGETDELLGATFTTDELRRRPPITVAPLSDYEATIAVPVTSDPYQHSIVRLIPEGEERTCTSIEDDVLSGDRPYVLGDGITLPGGRTWGREGMGDGIVDADDWRYDPAYDTYEFWRVYLEEGSHYQLCVWWVGSGGRSFDPEFTRVEDREFRAISTPDRLRASLRILGVAAPTRSGVTANSYWLYGHGCSVTLPTSDLSADTGLSFSGGLPFCDFRGTVQEANTEFLIRFPDDSERAFLIPTPNTGEPRTEVVRLDLSTERGSGLCGSSFGPCDPPTTVYPGPVIAIEVSLTEGATNGRDDWVVSSPLAFEAPERGPMALPSEIQIDWYSSGVVADGRTAVRVTTTFDRPVTLHAVLDGDPAFRCLTGEEPAYDSTTMSATHTFSLGGLCTLSPYSVRLEATDAAGTTTVFTSAVEPGTWIWDGFAYTDGWQVDYNVAVLTALAGDNEASRFTVEVAGVRSDLVNPTRCLTATTTPFRDGVWGDTVFVEIYVRVNWADFEDGRCVNPRRGYEWRGSVTATFTIDEFRSGRILVDVPLESDDTSDLGDGALTVVIQGTVRG